MSRNKVPYKNETISISLPIDQISFIRSYPMFNLSKFVQLQLQDHIDAVEDLEDIEIEFNTKSQNVLL